MSRDPNQGYFSDGITEDIITELSRLSELFIIARNSSFQYKGEVARYQASRQRGASLSTSWRAACHSRTTRHGPSSIVDETVFEPRGLNRKLRSLVRQKAGMSLFVVRGAGKFPGRSGASSWNRGSGSGRPWSRWAPRLRKLTLRGADASTARTASLERRI